MDKDFKLDEIIGWGTISNSSKSVRPMGVGDWEIVIGNTKDKDPELQVFFKKFWNYDYIYLWICFSESSAYQPIEKILALSKLNCQPSQNYSYACLNSWLNIWTQLFYAHSQLIIFFKGSQVIIFFINKDCIENRRNFPSNILNPFVIGLGQSHKNNSEFERYTYILNDRRNFDLIHLTKQNKHFTFHK